MKKRQLAPSPMQELLAKTTQERDEREQVACKLWEWLMGFQDPAMRQAGERLAALHPWLKRP